MGSEVGVWRGRPDRTRTRTPAIPTNEKATTTSLCSSPTSKAISPVVMLTGCRLHNNEGSLLKPWDAEHPQGIPIEDGHAPEQSHLPLPRPSEAQARGHFPLER